MDIYLKKAILHIIDRETGTPVISKLSTAQTKTGTLAENSSFVDTLRGIPSDFVKKSQEVTQHWYDVYSGSEDAPSADILFILYELDTVLHVAMIKLKLHALRRL